MNTKKDLACAVPSRIVAHRWGFTWEVQLLQASQTGLQWSTHISSEAKHKSGTNQRDMKSVSDDAILNTSGLCIQIYVHTNFSI